jgi:uncharacterized protein
VVLDPDLNPFRYGSLALDDAFTDRDRELTELVADVRNGQDVVIFAPRRYGKSSLVWRAAQKLVASKVLIAQVDLMTTPTSAKLAEKLAAAIHDDIASAVFRAKERLRVFQGLRVHPVVTVDPQDGTLGFSFDAAHSREDIGATLERLLELPAQLAAERNRRVALVFDEFQEITDIDASLPKLMRSVFQEQPDVAHVYLGSKRHMMQRIFNDENEPFWRSAKQMELGVIPPPLFADYIASRFSGTGRSIAGDVVARVLDVTGGHPYATQELGYFLWQETPRRRAATQERLDAALEKVLRSEHAHFSLIWDGAAGAQRELLQALAREPGRPLSGEYRRRHGLPPASTVQKALEALVRRELVAKLDGESRIAEPFLREWILAGRS